MLQSNFSFPTFKILIQTFFFRNRCKTVVEVLIITAMLFFASSVSAHKISSWEPYKSFLEQGECQELISHLKPLSMPRNWYDNRMWSQSRILNSKCQMQLENYKAALKSLKQTPESEERDVWLFQKIKVLLKSGNQSKAITNIRKLLKLPEKFSYLQSLRDELKNEFNTDKEVSLLFPLLHETRKNYKWFLSDYDLHALYIRGAKLKGIKTEHTYRVLGWQFPLDEKTARQSHKELTAKDLKNMSPAELLKRVRTLTRLGLNNYLVNHLPQLRKWRSRKVLKKLGKAYLKALFVERFYYRIIISHKKGQLSKLWSIPKETQLYWTARSFIKRRNIPDARSSIYKLERLNAKSKLLPNLLNTFAIRYMLDSEIEKSRFWWNRLLSHFPKHELAAAAAWRLAWSNLQQNNTKKALTYLKLGLKTRIYNSEMKAKLLYWQGKLQQSAGRPELAKKSFTKLLLRQPNTYYGMRLLSAKDIPESILKVAKSRQTKLYAEPTEPLSKKTKKLLKRIEFLFDIAEPEQALKELFAGMGRFKNSSRNWHVSHMLHSRGEHHALLRIFANYYLPRMISLEVGEYPLWELAYPRPYWSQLKNFANQAGIDPYFALAIMREESHFNPHALSSSKAIGLMQLMPATAKAEAKRIKIKLTGKAEIFDPELNTQLGTLYLGRLSNKFKSELIYTAGGYNAGPRNMSKWINRWNGKSLDVFVEQIPFKETRNYVKRVYRSYKLYKQIYSS
jgi:soluble lytic murein transglycosylase-like protein